MRFFRFTSLLAALLVLVLLAACTSDADPATTTTTSPDGTQAPATTTTTRPGETTTTTLPDLSGLDLPQVVITQLEEAIIATQEIRGLTFLETPRITVLDEAEFTQRVRDMVSEDLEDLPADEALYRLLGLLPRTSDLNAMLTDLYGEQVAGFYDPEEREIGVQARSDGLSVVQRGTMVHELVHALTDQHFGFYEHQSAMIDGDRWDELAAFRALLEGDATLTELQWIWTLSQTELGRFLAESLQVDTSVLDAMPRFIRDSLLFPYDSGLGFVQNLYDRGGWEAVNEAYQTMPGLPASTEQVITPADYGRDLPIDIPVKNVEIPGYELVVTSTWGELGLRLMFDQVLGETRSLGAADGWGGDYYHQWFDGQNAAFVLVYVGDTDSDIEQLRRALLDYQRVAIAPEAYVWVDEEGGYLHFVVADDPVVGELIKTAYGLD
jgi:hypothetical protein